jgi:hypothetical protein
MRRIRIPNIVLVNSEKTYLDADYTSGTTLTVIQSFGFQDNDIAVVGNVGEEKTESQDVTGRTGTTVIDISAALNIDHNKGTPVYRSEYDQVSIERDTVEITKSDIQWDKPETLYIDSTGNDSHSYRFRFYNSLTATFSEYSPTVAGSGFSRSQVGFILQETRGELRGTSLRKVSDTEIIRLFQEGQTVIQDSNPRYWFLKVDTFKADNGIATVADQSVYSLATYTDLNILARIRFNFNDGTDNIIYDLDPKDEIEFDVWVRDQDRATDDRATKFKLIPPDSDSDQGYFEIDPVAENSGNGTFYPVYFKTMAVVNDISDTTDSPLPHLLKYYALWRIHERLGNTVKANIYKKLFWGPSPQDKDRTALTGIALLEHKNKSQGIAIGKPQSLVRFRGQKAVSDMFERATLDRDSQAERYW